VNTDIKQDNRWLLIGAVGADCDELPPYGLDAISKKGFWFKIAAAARFPA
jgi:hypothetical protein